MTAAGAAKSVGTIGAALVTSSLLGFGLLAIVARWLPPDDNATFLTVWGLVFGLGSVISAIEQEIARQATRAMLRGERVPGSAVQLTAVALGAAGLAVVVVALLPLRESLFAGSLWVAALTFLAVGGFAVQFMSRGVFLGTDRIRRYAAVIVLEAFLRILLAGGLLLARAEPSIVWAVGAIVIGCFGWLPVVGPLRTQVEWRGGLEPWRRVSNRVGALGLANGLSSLVLTAFPTLVTALLGTAQGLATLFGAVTLSRVPLVLMSPVQAMVVPLATRLVATGRVRDLRALQTRLVSAALAVAVVAGALGYLLGPWVMTVFMGERYDASPAMMAVLVGSTVVMAAALIQAAVFIALERYWLVVATWATSVAATTVTLLVSGGSGETRGTAGFTVAALVAFVMATLLLRGATARHESVSAT